MDRQKGERERAHPIGISCWQNGRQKQETGLMLLINDISFPPLMPLFRSRSPPLKLPFTASGHMKAIFLFLSY